ncbi:lectizyme-like [Bradysia coprophila]|uniref:lectizyme-like n=1 Tax=Bradysia coprophila TaxID=38358 RepID=UPI00187DC418|nr:lectizyme-like [Bradysia coprophila]
MKILLVFFVFIVAAIAAANERSPAFVVSDGQLILNNELLLPSGTTRSSTFQFGFSSGRVVGGGDAVPNSAPWIVSLQWGTVRPSHFCGGSIISANWVLSAAHCTLAFPNYGISTVVAGLHDLNQFHGSEQIRMVDLSLKWEHEDFEGTIGPHDISLILIEEPFVFSNIVAPIFLPNADQIHSGDVTLFGWGSTSNTFYPTFPNILQTVSKPIIPHDVCMNQFAETPVHENNVCTGPLTGDRSACDGDAGSPLTQDDELVGIFSWGFVPCGLPNSPSFYVRVSAYVPWIISIIDRSKK